MKTEFVLCVKNDGYEASLEPFKLYRKAPAEPKDGAKGFLRVIDESGEDYLFPGKYFISNPVSSEISKVLIGKFRLASRHKVAA